jgi:hypothetical protein
MAWCNWRRAPRSPPVGAAPERPASRARQPKKATGQKEMQLLIEGKMPKKASAKTTAAKPEHKSA